MLLDLLRVTTPPSYVTDQARWHQIDRQRMRAAYWYVASIAMKAAGWILSIGTVIVAAITAGRPGFIYGPEGWPDGLVRSWSTAVAIMSGLSALVPWQKTGRAFERAHEMLIDVITLYDSDPACTVQQVVDGAHQATQQLQLGDPPAPPASSPAPGATPAPASAPPLAPGAVSATPPPPPSEAGAPSASTDSGSPG